MHIYKDGDVWMAEEDDGELRNCTSIEEIERQIAYLKTQMTPDTELTFDAHYTLKRPATETEIHNERMRQAAEKAQHRASRLVEYEALKREFELQ